MAFDSTTRGKLQRLVAACRKLLTDEFDDQLQSLYGIYADDGRVLEIEKLTSLDDDQSVTGALLRERIAHLQSGLTSSETPLKDAVQRVLREQAFTVLNRFAAVRMAEERELVLQCVGDGLNSKGFQVFENIASPDLGSQYERYCVFLGCLFDELSLDLGILFDRFSPLGLLFPREPKLKEFLALLNDPELKSLWREDETIGWIYQYFNDEEERKQMRKDSSAPRNSRELAVRNQFFTPRYVVEFLTDNTLGRLWYEMTRGQTRLKEQCRYLVRRPTEIFLKPDESAPESTAGSQANTRENLSHEELLRQPVHIPHRPLKDPREIRLLDPACGSMHFGLYAFDLFTVIYEEWWDAFATEEQRAQLVADLQVRDGSAEQPITDKAQQRALFVLHLPRLIVEHNLHGIDIDPRAAQIAGLSLWLRAQRAWHQAGVKPADRLRITRSNLVCAEPMPGEKELLREFVEQQFPAGERPAFAFLLEKIFDRMTLAGEAGSLLRIEEEIRTAIADTKRLWKQGPRHEQASLFSEPVEKAGQGEMRLDLSGITDEQFWERAEQRIYDALEAYAERAENGGGFQRRLFADDAAQGFAFIDLCRKRYDVVVMNPPFGAPSPAFAPLFEQQYPHACSNFLCAFTHRGAAMCCELGIVGAITDRTWLQKTTYEPFRDTLLSNDHCILTLADLGWGVLDDAQVAVCMYSVGEENLAHGQTLCVDVRAEPEEGKPGRLRDALANNEWKVIFRETFSLYPDKSIAHWCPESLKQLFLVGRPVHPNFAESKRGFSAGDTALAFRLEWEVPAQQKQPGKRWSYIQNGGSYSPFYRDTYLVCWSENSLAVLKPLKGVSLKNLQYVGRIGLTWAKRTDFLGPCILAAGHYFTDEGSGLFTDDKQTLWFLLGILNSRTFQYTIDLFCGQHKSNGYVGKLPIPSADISRRGDFGKIGAECYRIAKTCSVSCEPNTCFVSALTSSEFEALKSHGLRAILEILFQRDCQSSSHLKALQGRLDSLASELASVNPEDSSLVLNATRSRQELSSFLFCDLSKDRIQYDASRVHLLLSYIFGLVLGRWDIRYTTGQRPAPELPDPFAPLSVCPPGMLQGDDGLPLSPEAGRRLRAEGRYPLEVAWDGILVDDPEHPLDLERRVHTALAVLWGDRADTLEHEACALLGVPTLREWFRRPVGFFADHLKRYSKSRRQAPIYWPLSTASGRYTLWLYYHRLNDQTLFTCVTDFVKPKLDTVTADADRLQSRTQTGGTAKERAELQELRDFQAELEDLHDELLRVTQLPWKPNLNDGVLITASPLWKLFRLPKWQKDLKVCWEELAAGDYDWAHLAHTIWPDRVREMCKTDRSLAIAHGLEDLCEVEAPKPKTKRGKKGGKLEKLF